MDSGAGGPVSRLQAAKAAVIKQLEQLKTNTLTVALRSSPSAKTSTYTATVRAFGSFNVRLRWLLTTFLFLVKIIRNRNAGSARPRKLTGSVIEDREQLMSAAKAEALPESVRQRKQAMATQVKALQTEGSTALGPGLLLAVQLAGRVPGSRVVLCTDGCANHGLGKLNMNMIGVQSSPDQGPAFYQQLGEKAKQLSVTVNVISFQGVCSNLHVHYVRDVYS